MARWLNVGVAAALVFAIAAPEAQAVVRHPRDQAVPPGHIIVHARRSYLDPGPTGAVGTGNRYVTDTAPASLAELGSTFGAFMGSVLPSRFNPPGRPAPLVEFSTP